MRALDGLDIRRSADERQAMGEGGRATVPLRVLWMRPAVCRRRSVLQVFRVATLALPSISVLALAGQDKQAGEKLFAEKVKPALQAHCLSCHSGSKPSGGLSLESRATLLKGGATGPAFDSPNPTGSLLLRAVNYRGPKMPPRGKLPKATIDAITEWAKLGAPWPEEKAKAAGHGAPVVDEQAKRFWSFRKVARPKIPSVRNVAWARTPIDAFVLSKLEKAGLQPAPEADRRTLLRRASYGLTGLPPSPEEVRAFEMDRSADAWEKVVDRLLASPHYGERWARHWMDVVRYAETNSFERDNPKPFVWRYRDYLIRSLNDDKPYDRQILEQLAGDELPDRTPETLIATGYYRLGAWDDEPADPLQARYDDLDDILTTTGQAFLGLTVNCGRCHDHKTDPFPQRDYYRLLAFFQGVNRYGIRGDDTVERMSLRPISPKEEQDRFRRESEAHRAKLEENRKRLDAIEAVAKADFLPVEHEEFRDEGKRLSLLAKRVPKVLSEGQFLEYRGLTEERDRLRRTPPKGLEMALCVTERAGAVAATHVLMRGNPHAKGEEVQPGFPSVLSPPEPSIVSPGVGAETSGRRLALARWIASSENPLTARVIANRVWQRHFGRGIVRSPNNFGYMGDPPTHPELLDYLASELVGNGWRLKALHKQILMSSTYRMSSTPSAKALAKDPANDLLQRFDMRRLDAEEIRDSILWANGSLDLKTMYGPSVYPEMPAEALAGQSIPGYGWRKATAADETRRAVYIHVKRSLPVPMLASFDSADTDFTCPVRFATTQPTQALGLLNSVWIHKQAARFAEGLLKQAFAGESDRVRVALTRVLQRNPARAEVERGIELIRSLREEHGASEEEALKQFCVVALSLNEFVYLD